MCRICGRMVKCIFDTMPSRTFPVPSRRAFTTIRRSPVTSNAGSIHLLRPTTALTSISNLTTRFSSLRLSSPTHLSATPTSPALQIRAFSATAQVGGPRATYKPSRKVQKRRHGYLSRAKTKSGQAILKRRTLKGRKYLSW